MPEWPGTPTATNAALPPPQWPGTPAQPPQAQQWPGTPAQQSAQQPKGFYESLTEHAGKGVEAITEAATQPSQGIFPTRIPRMIGGAATILTSPIEAASDVVESWFPSLKKAQQQGQILPLERPGDIALGAFGMGETKGLQAFGKGARVGAEAAEGARAAEAVRPAEATPSQFTVAMESQGKVYPGKPGQVHSDIIEQHKLPYDETLVSGFTDAKNKFYTREEAAKSLGETTLHATQQKPVAPPPKISPETKQVAADLKEIITPGSKEAAQATIRKQTGLAARDTAQTAAAFEPYHALINSMSREEQLAFIQRLESPKVERTGPISNWEAQLGGLEDVLRDAMELRRSKLEAMPVTAKMEFVENYYPHMWQDPTGASKAMKGAGGYGRMGSGASLKERSIPTIADGIKRGLIPATTDPIETAMRYVNSMDRFIAQRTVLDVAKADGTVRYIHPESIGASGHPDSVKGIPEGWEKLRNVTDKTGAQAYAPPEWARVYNNMVSRGIHDWAGERAGNIYEKARRATNSVTAAELSLSAFHLFNMAQEAIVTDVARSIKALTKGQLGTAGKAFARAPIAPYKLYQAGKKGEQVYLGRSPGTEHLRNIINTATEAGARGVGRSHALDYRMSAMGDLWTSFRRGALAKEFGQSAQNIKNNPFTGVASETFKLVGRIMETTTAPLFDKYIPRLKLGAIQEELRDWLEAHPGAHPDEINRAARTIVDTVDDRFGEVIQDNVFWNQTFKQLSQLSLRSFSWDLGTARLFTLGAKDLLQTAAGRQELSSRAAVLLAMPIVWGSLNALYQGVKTAIKTGKPVPPQSIDDLMAGRTGGDAPGASVPSAKPFGKSTREIVDERAMMPGYMKDLFAWYYEPGRSAINKLATLPRAAWLAGWNIDYRGLPIADIDHGLMTAIGDYFKWAEKTFGPFTLKEMWKGEKTGSGISRFEQALGIRPAPTYLSDPGGHELGAERYRQRLIKQRDAADRKQEELYGGTKE